MISIKNLKGGQGGGAGAVANYCEHQLVLHQETHTRAEYTTGYYRDGSTPSAWHGAGAAALGLSGPVDRDTLVRILEGRLPDGSDLTQRGHVPNRRLGVDLTISAPKSVSLQALAGGDERMLAAHDRAVAAALDLVEREVLTARRGKGGRAREVTGSLVAATYRHEDARPVAGHVDPQLHTHCLLANATQRADGTWSAMDLQFGEGSVLMHLADAHYKSELARALQALGYGLRRTGDGFELGHITDEQIARFSQRRGQIDAALAARGLTRETSDATDRVLANLATREDKTQGDQSDQAWTWRQEAREAGIVLDRPAAGYAVTVPDLSHEAVKSGTRHLAERETVFRRDAVRLEALQAGLGDTSLAGVDRAIEAKAGGLLDAGDNQFTTRDALHREQEILARARAGQGQASALMTVSGGVNPRMDGGKNLSNRVGNRGLAGDGT
ncbi:MAG: MobF family relaxase [Candidatus Dormibacteria bacterium]